MSVQTVSTGPDAASRAQIAAADPARSTWVAANAGSGKTRVLTNRVARLLLAGTPPERILCLTFTRAAAANMQNTLFERLGRWAMLPESELRAALSDLGEDGADFSPAFIARARTLFARALETPGGLRIQTIHAFCAALLRRFPLEAGLSPRFVEMDERATARMRAEILDAMSAEPAGREALDALARHLGGDDLGPLVTAIAQERAALATPPDRAALWKAMGLPQGLTEADVPGLALRPEDGALFSRMAQVLRGQSRTMVEFGEVLAAADAATPDFALLKALMAKVLTAKGEIKKTALSPNAARALADEMPEIEHLFSRIADARNTLLSLAAAERSHDLHRFAALWLAAYEARKAALGCLDFDDLILRSRALLSRADMAQWVLYRLDGAIDHILVDEAQDTSPAQWEVIGLLAREFLSGEGARAGVARTLFVVGDEKQSIYSFQGADPDAFERMRSHFDDWLSARGDGLARGFLEHSFRSSGDILGLVDAAFAGERGAGVERNVSHRAFHERLPGRVELWPLLDKAETAEKGAWDDPVDMPAPDDPVPALARAIARFLRDRIEAGAPVPRQDGRVTALRPGDVLILVQRRSAIFHEIIRALKAEGLPVAGADRLKVGGELAVRDLVALLSFLALPEDDLSLATVLRSPLIGLSEADLYDLAHRRRAKETLWQALREREVAYPDAHSLLRDLRDRADFWRPYELLERVLGPLGGRARLIARLGQEAEEGIDALLARALAYEAGEVPGLTGFLSWLSAVEEEVRRQIDDASDEIRVMTVHGAKGLEAPLVILPDTAKRERPSRTPDLLPLAGGIPAWLPPADARPALLQGAVTAAQVRAEEERARLLYVALTRAETWLVVCGVGQSGEEPRESWHGMVEAGLEERGSVPFPTPVGEGLALIGAGWPDRPAAPEAAAPAQEAALPGWAVLPATPPPAAPALLSPSDLGGAKVIAGPGDGEGDLRAALERGTWVHMLLEHLPRAAPRERAALAARLLPAATPPAPAALVPALLAEAEAVLAAPALAPLFGPEALAEVEIAAPLPGGAMLSGVIDRLLVTPERVLAADFKTNRVLPASPREVPEGLLRQMGAYAHALAPLYPGRRIETALVWTRTAEAMILPPGMAEAAFARALSESGGRS